MGSRQKVVGCDRGEGCRPGGYSFPVGLQKLVGIAIISRQSVSGGLGHSGIGLEHD